MQPEVADAFHELLLVLYESSFEEDLREWLERTGGVSYSTIAILLWNDAHKNVMAKQVLAEVVE